MMIRLKRIYEDPSEDDGERILVERLWPRGMTKQRAAVDLWLKDLAPSPELRRWFSHDPDKWPTFLRRYWEELNQPEKQPLIATLRQKDQAGTVTLVFASRDPLQNSTMVVKAFLSGESPIP